jgi:hypothetical protein
MLPSILPGSRLHVEARDGSSAAFEVGDVVCFLDGSKKFVSHRVVAIVCEGSERKLMVAGDSSGQPEELDETAVVGVVTRVDHLLLSYETRGTAGKMMARWALRRPQSFRGALLAAELMTQLYAKVSRFVRRIQKNTL